MDTVSQVLRWENGQSKVVTPHTVAKPITALEDHQNNWQKISQETIQISGHQDMIAKKVSKGQGLETHHIFNFVMPGSIKK